MPDAVDRLTPLGLMLLALLHEDDMHAYEMVRLLRDRKSDRLVALTHGTIYHTVARLERQGLIAQVGIDRPGVDQYPGIHLAVRVEQCLEPLEQPDHLGAVHPRQQF